MKKILILFIFVIALTGCKSKYPEEESLYCNFTNTYAGSEFTTDIDVEIKKNIVTNAKAVMTFKDEKFAASMCDVFKLAKDSSGNIVCDDLHIIINNYHKSISAKDMTKDEFIEYMKNQDFTCEEK